MKIYKSHVFVTAVLAVVFVIAGCSKKKATFTSKLYHSTTTHYNYYFNANEIMRLTELSLWANKSDDYLEILPVYVLPNEEEQINITPQMDEVIEKCSTTIDRHSIDVKKKEHNKWIDDSFLLIGKANFYKGKLSTAQEMFGYIAKKYKTEDTRYYAALWLARTYIEQERYSKATTVLSLVDKDDVIDVPKDFRAKLETVYSDLFLRQKRYKDAIPHLDAAANLTKDKPMKARLTYIYAQCNKEVNRSQEAINAFGRVVKLKPEYEMEFYAKINQALSYDRKMDATQIKTMLWAMIKDEKNIDYYDQIYYALAGIEIEIQNIEEALELLQLSAKYSTVNMRQKGRTYLKMAEIYFVDREYVLAKNYYDSTATYLPEDYPDYDIIVATGASLNDLVDNLHIVSYNDSLIALAMMDEKDRDKKIMNMIASLEEEEEIKRQAELDALQQLQNQTAAGGRNSSSSGRTWYFYNSSTLSSGFQEFQRQWGSRKLEDNWRRSVKTEIEREDNFDMESDSAIAGTNLGQEESNVKSLEEYTANLPLSDSSLTRANNEIIAALYEIGTIYAEQLKDDDNAIESFLRITNEYDTSSTALPAYYQLYRIYVAKEQSGSFVGTGFKDNSDYYKNVILADYPDSEFAKLILDPNYVTSKNQQYEEEKERYEYTYKQFNRRQYSQVLLTCNEVIADEPQNSFLAKYWLIKALAVGAQKNPEAYETLLREIITQFRGTPEADKAEELLEGLNEAKANMGRNTPNDTQASSDPDTQPSGNTASAAGGGVDFSMYTYDADSEHFFALVFAKADGNSNSIKNSISDFNLEYFNSDNLRITNSFIDQDNQIIIVRTFGNEADAMRYYRGFLANDELLKDVNSGNFDKFVISTKNFTVLFRNKNLAVYNTFFDAKYK